MTTNQNTERRSVEELSIPVPKLQVMNRLGEVGVEGIEERLQRLQADATVESELVKHGYVEADSVDSEFRETELVGARIHLPGVPYGYAVVLFPVHSANNAAAMMLADTVEDVAGTSEEMARSALTELGAIVASGFLDRWANKFEQEIDLAEPVAVHNTERHIVRRTIRGRGEYGIYVTTRIRLPAHGVRGQVYLFPDNETFVELIDRADVDMLR